MLQYSDANTVLQAILLTLRCASRSEKVTILGSDLFNDDPDLFRAVIHVSVCVCMCVYVCVCVCVCARLLFGKSYLACVLSAFGAPRTRACCTCCAMGFVVTHQGVQGVAEGWADGVVMRPEKLGTVTDVLDNATMFTALAPPARALRVVLAHRPGPRAGEVEADLAVGIGAWGIKSGMPGHATMGKLNRLILIEEQLAHMDKAARAGAEPQLQTAHLRKWEQVYATEAAAAQQYAEAAELAAQGP